MNCQKSVILKGRVSIHSAEVDRTKLPSDHFGMEPLFAGNLGAVSTSPPASNDGGRAMSRLRAERIIAAAQRLSAGDNSRNGETGIGATTKSRQIPSTATRTVSALVPAAEDLYLQQSGVNFLLEDLVKRLQEVRPDNPSTFIANYFASAVNGSHVRGRDYEFVNGTLRNRIAFLTEMQRGLVGVDMSMEITSDDFAEIVWSHCSDFPTIPLSQACSHLEEGPEASIIATLQHFMAAFASCFVYNDFLTRVNEVYAELVLASRETQSSSPRGGARSESIASAMAADRVVARLRLIAQQTWITVPPLGEVESFVFKSASFKEFCAQFFLSPAIAAAIHELQAACDTLSRSDNQT